MKSILKRLAIALILAITIAGCHTIQQESAMQWMERQPRNLDP